MNLRKKNTPAQNRRVVNTDGFVSGASGFKPRQQNSEKRADFGTLFERKEGSDFNRTEGFHPKTVTPSNKPVGAEHLGAKNSYDESHKIPDQVYGAPFEGQKTFYSKGKDENYRLHKIVKDKQDKKHRKTGFLRSKKMKFAGVMVMCFLLVGGYFFGKGYLTAREIFKGGGTGLFGDNVDPSLLRTEGDGRINVLLLGRGGENHEGADLTDTILVASLDPVNNKAGLLSIPRDLWVQTETYGSMKINAVFASAKNAYLADPAIQAPSVQKAEEAGFSAIEKTVESAMGIPVHYHAVIDFDGFEGIVDAVGGVTMNVEEAVYEPMEIDGRQYILDVKPGLEQFDGFRALAYSRSRYTSTRGDFSRSERQRDLLIAIKDKVFSLGTMGNPAKISQLMTAFGGSIRTNLELEDLLRMYEVGQLVSTSTIDSVGLADPPNEFLMTSMVGDQSVVVPRAGINNYAEIHNFLRNEFRDGYLAKENAKINVYNGTNISGLASRSADNLKSYGYRIGEVGDYNKKDGQTTILINPSERDNPYTRHYLEQRFRAPVTEDAPTDLIVPPDVDFVIILGPNEVTRLQN
jgi:polyisoprenyl-teichoic acid--peptidoglycan teichoic acid transferase